METKQHKFKILLFPWLAHGHIYPFLELAKTLSARNFSTYLCSTPVNLDEIKANDPKNELPVKLIELHIPPLPELPSPSMHTTKKLPYHLVPALIKAIQTSSPSFLNILDSVNPDLLIFDLFQPWAPKLASSKGIPSVLFSTSGATPVSFYHHIYSTRGMASTFPSEAIFLHDHERVDLSKRITSNLKDADEGFGFGTFARSTDIVLVKSSRVVEGKYIDYLSTLSSKQIVSTGPLIVDPSHNEEKHSKIMKWLSRKDHRSTIYISFGSECFLSAEQITEIARGLRVCQANFLWVLRFPIGEQVVGLDEHLPAGFIEAVGERGRVVGDWAPQTRILAHPSVGGFVSHCGWSSVTESMYFGVPIVGMPMRADQPINARLAVEIGVGVEVGKDTSGKYYSGEEVATAIDKVVLEEVGQGLRDRANRLSERMRGNAKGEMNEAVDQLLKICKKLTCE